LSPGPSPLSRILDRFFSLIASIADGARRARYRRAEFRRIAALEMVSDRAAGHEAFRWLPAVRVRGRRYAALTCGPNARVTYDVMLPPHATLLSWCSLSPEAWDRDFGSVEFEIHVRTESAEASARCLVGPGRQRFGPRWHALRVRSPEAGPARIVLTTRRADGGEGGGLCALWGSPRIETPRSPGDLMSVLRSAISARGLRGLWHQVLPATSDRLYRLWVREHELSSSALRAQRRWSQDRAQLFSLITFVARPAAWRHRRTAASVQRQSYPGWEWILVATEESMRNLGTATGRIRHDPRVRLLSVPSGSTPADAWNAALGEARGEFAAILGQDDVLAQSALYEMANALDRVPGCDLAYSDEDRIGPRDSHRHEPHFKPDWSPELLLATNYIGRLAVLRVGTATALGGFRGLFGGSEEWDLFLRLSRSAARVERVPRCLYHREATDSTGGESSGQAVVLDHCQKLGLPAAVTRSDDQLRVVWDVGRQPLVSIVIPNRNAAAMLKQCVSGLVERTNYKRLELVVVDNGSTETEVLELYRSIEREKRGTIVPFHRPFNFSAACNAGAGAARGELLLFLNNDTEVIQPDWLDELVRWAELPHVGIVGAKLLYPDRTIQHAGVVFGLGLVGHIFARAAEGASSVFGSSESYRNYLAVTGACQMMRREVFEQLGGFDERFRLTFSDVVLCMEAWKAGYRVVYTPHARLVHHESYTRRQDDSAEDMELLARYLRDHRFSEDPYFHPELDPKSSTPAVRPPFDPTSRQVVRDFVDRVLVAAPAPHEGGRP
jgi:GT2 family glycosyltransferase